MPEQYTFDEICNKIDTIKGNNYTVTLKDTSEFDPHPPIVLGKLLSKDSNNNLKFSEHYEINVTRDEGEIRVNQNDNFVGRFSNGKVFHVELTKGGKTRRKRPKKSSSRRRKSHRK
jgi:hypothetical protein